MTTQTLAPTPPPRIDQLRYWVGAGLTAALAGLAGVIGLTIAHGIAHVPVLITDGAAATPLNTAGYGLLAAGYAAGAAALYAAMLRVAPRPASYYSWVIGMLTALAVLVPFTTGVALTSQVALGATNLVVGLVVLLLVPLAAVKDRTPTCSGSGLAG